MARSLISPKPTAAANPAAGRLLRILYADDLPELRDVAQVSLGREGYDVECFADGALALARMLRKSDFDLVITDHHMPNMNGLEFVKNLRESGYAGKVMVFSSELSELVARDYRAQKVDRILYKPVFPSLIRQTLHELFPAHAA